MVVGANFLLSHGMEIAQRPVISELNQELKPGRVQTQHQRMVARVVTGCPIYCKTASVNLENVQVRLLTNMHFLIIKNTS